MYRILKPYRILRPLSKTKIKPTNPSDPTPIKPKKEPLLMIGFDDGYESDYTIAFPEMTSRGIKGTSFINSEKIGTPGHLTLSQMEEMRDAGWDFQDHTPDHANLTNLTEQEIRDKMEESNRFFESINFEIPKHFTYPYLKVTLDVMEVVKEYRLSGRAGNAYTEQVDRINTFDGINLDAYTCFEAQVRSSGNLGYVKSQVNKIKNMKGIGSFLLHSLAEHEDDLIDSYAGLKSYFIDTLEYVVASGIRTVTVSEMYDIVTSYKDNNATR